MQLLQMEIYCKIIETDPTAIYTIRILANFEKGHSHLMYASYNDCENVSMGQYLRSPLALFNNDATRTKVDFDALLDLDNLSDEILNEDLRFKNHHSFLTGKPSSEQELEKSYEFDGCNFFLGGTSNLQAFSFEEPSKVDRLKAINPFSGDIIQDDNFFSDYMLQPSNLNSRSGSLFSLENDSTAESSQTQSSPNWSSSLDADLNVEYTNMKGFSEVSSNSELNQEDGFDPLANKFHENDIYLHSEDVLGNYLNENDIAVDDICSSDPQYSGSLSSGSNEILIDSELNESTGISYQHSRHLDNSRDLFKTPVPDLPTNESTQLSSNVTEEWNSNIFSNSTAQSTGSSKPITDNINLWLKLGRPTLQGPNQSFTQDVFLDSSLLGRSVRKPVRSNSLEDSVIESSPTEVKLRSKRPKPKKPLKNGPISVVLKNDMDIDTAMALATTALTKPSKPQPVFKTPADISSSIRDKFSEAEIKAIKLAEVEKTCFHCDAKFENYRELLDHYEQKSLFLKHPHQFACPVKSCPMNAIGFMRKVSLRQHVMLNHYTKGYLRSEFKEHANELRKVIYSCRYEQCKKGFNRKDSLTRHVRLVHGVTDSKRESSCTLIIEGENGVMMKARVVI